MIDEFLVKLGVPYEKLEEEEKKTLLKWFESLKQQQITVEDIKNNIRKMADSVAKELCEYELPKKKDIFLKARLRNYLMLLDFLVMPEEAKQHLEKYLKGIKF